MITNEISREITTIAKQFGLLRGGTFSVRLDSVGIVTITIPTPEVEPKFTSGGKYGNKKQIPTKCQAAAIRVIAAELLNSSPI